MSRPSNPGRRHVFGSAGAMLLLIAAEAGPGKADELDAKADAMVAGLPPLPHYPLWTEADQLRV